MERKRIIEMLHKFRTEPIEGQPICEKVFIDDLCVQCSSYEVRHSAGNIPRVTIEMGIVPSFDTNAKIKIGNLSEIARQLWTKIHLKSLKGYGRKFIISYFGVSPSLVKA